MRTGRSTAGSGVARGGPEPSQAQQPSRQRGQLRCWSQAEHAGTRVKQGRREGSGLTHRAAAREASWDRSGAGVSLGAAAFGV